MIKNRVLFLLSFTILIAVVSFSVSAAVCWDKTQSTCTTVNGCKWKNDSWSTSGWCEELNCWSLSSSTECTTTNVPGKNCTWQAGGTSYGCEKLTCWSLSGTNASSCSNNTAGLNCEWQSSCYSSGYNPAGTSCWNLQNQSACLNATGCSWGQCNEKGCWSYNTGSSCNAAKDWNGKNCTWNSASSYCEQNGCWKYSNQSTCTNTFLTGGLSCQWKWNSCQEVDCYNWDFTNETSCVNNTANLSCTWSGSYCNKKDCWSYNTQSTCQAKPNCLWRAYVSSGWCNEVNCWTWDSYNGGNQSRCVNNNYGLSCTWSGNPAGNLTNGWCYKSMAGVSCANKTTERDCMDTFYCWWQYTNWNNPSLGGSCNEPGTGGGGIINISILNDWNPGCYIFDMNSSDCNNVIGCNYSSGKCVSLNNAYGGNITANGLNCSYINSSSLCNSIPALASCCSWQNGTCASNKLSSSCRDQMQATPVGASFCEDYNSYANQALCEQIAGSPWYMPCQWNNATSKCGFKASDVFGNDSYSIIKIDNKKGCEAAGGKWITENYCEGNISVPTGRCEYKFDEETNCDKACFACESKDSSGLSINASNAASACSNSKLGICEFVNNTRAPNGVGYCKAKDQFKKGVAGDCDSNCGDCSYKGSSSSNDTTKKPSYYCLVSKANSEGGGCKWINDNSTIQGGYCFNKGEKTCEDSCDRCKSQSDCANLGRTNVANQTGSCKWQGGTTSTTGSCVANIGQDVEICWNGIDDNDNNLVDCADSSCYADSSCGMVSGDCFGWTNNNTCIAKSCEWVTDKWGSWCDFKGSQCWKYNQNTSICNANTNCQWNNGTGTSTGWCEKDWSQQESCMGLNRNACMALNASGCNWTIDSWCSGTGNGTSWCNNNGGWCDNTNFKPKDCWKYSSSSSCSAVSGCGWKTDQYSQPHCEVNWSANCWMNMNNSACDTNSHCIWTPSPNGAYYCTFKADTCYTYTQSTCASAFGGGSCYWRTWSSGGTGGGVSGSCDSVCYNGSLTSTTCSASTSCIWKAESGWCEETEMASCTNSSNSNNQTRCQATSGCRWKTNGWCDPKGGGFSAASNAAGGGVGSGMGGDCYKYDGNITLCTNKTIINISCGWTVNNNPSCEINWATECWRYTSSNISLGCNVTNGCWYKNESFGGFCTNIMDQCWNNVSYQSWSNPTGWAGNCSANPLCINNSWGGCEPRCSSLNSSSCINTTYAGKCKYSSGWCNPKGMNDMFSGMESGAAAPLGFDNCSENIQASVDICGFGMRDMGDSYGFGSGMRNFENASVCNKEKLSSFVMGGAGGTGGGSSGGGMPAGGGAMTTSFGQERTGAGNDSVIYIVYLDTDGSTSGGCTLSHNSSAVGYEFRFKYSSIWNANTSKAVETFNAYKCENSEWKATDLAISAWKKKMCSEIGGPMIAIKKADLGKYSSLYDSTKDIRVSVATIGNTGNISYPSDYAGPGWTTPGSIDFEIQNAFAYGADTAKFEDILKKGFVQGEDCFNSIDDDNDGNLDCNDWDCQYSSKCTSTGVNAANYTDTSSPLVTGAKIEEYPDAALIMYDTNKPTNGTLELFGDSQCLNRSNIINDIGILSANVRDYKLWHTALIYDANNTNISLNWPPVAGSTYYYKLKVCDTNNKCAVSKCTSFKFASSIQKCSYCNFVTRIKMPSGWMVAYDVDKNGIYEHVQGEVCGPNAGMKTNYTSGRKVNIKLYKSDGTAYIELINASLTKTGLNDKVRTVSSSGNVIGDSRKVGLTSETRDKLINNLHPEICRIKIPVASGTTCNTLYHCDDNGENCVDRTAAAGGAPVDAANCVWNVPYCEFSTYQGASSPGGGGGSSGGGGGGGAAGSTAGTTYSVNDEQFKAGYTKELKAGDKVSFNIENKSHSVSINSSSARSIKVIVSSTPQERIIGIGQEANFDVTDDVIYDVLVKYNSYNYSSNKSEILVKSINKPVTTAPVTGEAIGETGAGEEVNARAKGSSILETNILRIPLIWIILGVIAIIIIVLIIYFIKRK
jgi:hypothetical protein